MQETFNKNPSVKSFLSKCVEKNLIVGALRVSKRWFGSNLSKSTKLCPDIAHTILFRFPPTAKTDDWWGRHIGKIQYGHHRWRISNLASKLNSSQSWITHVFYGFFSVRESDYGVILVIFCTLEPLCCYKDHYEVELRLIGITKDKNLGKIFLKSWDLSHIILFWLLAGSYKFSLWLYLI